MTDQTTPLRDRIARAIYGAHSHVDVWDQADARTRAVVYAEADAVLAVLPAPADRAAVRPTTLHAIARHLEARADRIFRVESQVRAEYAAVAAELRRVADETATTETQAHAPVVDLPARLEAALTERYTELGNPFAEMRRQEQGPDGWPASHPVGPHHVAETLRELLAAGARQDGASS
ncbi:hypothetical protein ACFW4Q_02360 [Streptomyces rochei]|uniref:hypothetical protein n=1 Tax=Streptomyces rochei TaxID=1928 RepID=UPI003691F493